MTRGLSAEALLRLPVRLRGIKLGAPDDLVVDWAAMRAVGIEVVCGDDARRFLPLAAARVGAEEIAVTSALLLLEEHDLVFYRRRARAYRDLRGRAVERGTRRLGLLRDLVLAESGAVRELVVETGGGRRRRLRPDPSLTVAGPSRATAA